MTQTVVQEDGAARTEKKRMTENEGKRRRTRPQKEICSNM